MCKPIRKMTPATLFQCRSLHLHTNPSSCLFMRWWRGLWWMGWRGLVLGTGCCKVAGGEGGKHRHGQLKHLAWSHSSAPHLLSETSTGSFSNLFLSPLHVWCAAQSACCGSCVVLHKRYKHAPHAAEKPVAGVGPASLFTVIPAWLPPSSIPSLLLQIFSGLFFLIAICLGGDRCERGRDQFCIRGCCNSSKGSPTGRAECIVMHRIAS